MSTNDPIEALELLNKKYISLLHSKEMSLGKSLLLHKSYLKKGSFVKIIKRLFARIIEKKLQRNAACLNDEIFFNKGDVNCGDERGVVYTCITKGYDDIKEPLLCGKNIDYVCFCDDDIRKISSTWLSKKIPNVDALTKGTMVNRYCKLHPFDFFSGYDYAIYIDGNVCPVSDLTQLYSVAKNSKSGFAIHLHSRRKCVYKEIDACLLYKRGNVDAIKLFKSKIEKDHFPENFGLLEATVFVIDMHNEIARNILDEWWNILVKSETRRDQLILPYVLWKMGLTLNDIGVLGNNVYENPLFFVLRHSLRE